MVYKRTVGCGDIQIDTKRIDNNLKNAQIALNMKIVGDCDQYVPFQQGALRGSVRYPEGMSGGVIEYDTPYAHYQYMGEVYGPNIPRYDSDGNLIGYWSPPQKHPTGRPLQQHSIGTTDHWFERAKDAHLKEWIEVVKREAGKE